MVILIIKYIYIYINGIVDIYEDRQSQIKQFQKFFIQNKIEGIIYK